MADIPITVYGDVDTRAVDQLRRCAEAGDALRGALCADGHVGYSQPIGGAVAYPDHISPSGVGYDIACGNKAAKTNLRADDVRADAPVWLTTGRVLAQYQSGAQTRRVPALAGAAPGPYVELHPELARRHDIEDGDRVAVTSARGRVVGAARISAGIRTDTVFVPFHWPGEGSPNLVTSSATDPVSGMPEFKVCAVSIAREET